MPKIKIAINGFGRIGRSAFKIALNKKNAEVVAINDLTDTKTLAQLLKYDSVYGVYDKKVGADAKNIIVNGRKYPVFAVKEPNKLPWKKMGVDVVLECTGIFRDSAMAGLHLKAGAKKVIVSAPPKGDGMETFVLGVNDMNYRGEKVVSNASCTTNCVAPVAAIIHARFGVKKAMMTTIHSYTADQNLVDGPHKDPRRARAAAHNIVPTTTGAASAVNATIPELQGLFDGLAVRVPTICGSLSDFTFLVNKKTTAEAVNRELVRASRLPRWKNVVEVSNDPLVSSDIIGNPASTIVDLSLTKVVDDDLVKVIAWYDNEWGYANRLIELAGRVSQLVA